MKRLSKIIINVLLKYSLIEKKNLCFGKSEMAFVSGIKKKDWLN